jgi:beta-glucosidase
MVRKEDRLRYDGKAMAIVSQMTLEEKIKLMSGRTSVWTLTLQFISSGSRGYHFRPFPAGGCERLGVPELLFCDGPRGVLPGSSTCFPVTMARGASFDRDLEERVGEVMGKEVRAVGGNLFGGVCINLPYNPGWGRSQEVYGEDSMHLGKMGSALVRGVQKHNVLACLKHYAFNSMELARFKVNVKADKRTEREIYLRHFKESIDAGAAAVMSAYNKYQGEFCGQNDYLLNQVLKGEWDFDGIVITDFVYGLKDTVKGANSGQDVEMPDGVQFTKKKMMAAIKNGSVKEETIDKAAVRIVRTLLAFKEAKDPQEYSPALSACEEHVNLAREVAEKSITLLKNKDRTLPFDANKMKKLVMVGDLGTVQNTGDHGSSHIKRTKADTLMEALQQKFGVGNVIFIKTKDAGNSIDQISKADAVIIMAGMRHSDEGEYLSTSTKIGGDRKSSLGLPQNEIDMITRIGRINKNTAVVLIGGSMLMVDPWFENVPAVIMAYYPGMKGGLAITRVLFGDVNPSGKLPFVIPYKESDLPQVDWLADEQVYGYYHGYAKLDKESIQPRLPFGFGLSYTTFELDLPKFKGVQGRAAVFEAEVKNIGTRAGGEVVQLYVGWNSSRVDRPVKRLQDFAKVHLDAGESRKVELRVQKSDLAYFDETSNAFVEEDTEYTAYVSNSSDISNVAAIPFQFQ